MLLARLRWSAFGLRGRIVGAVLVTTAVSLGVAALVLLPRLESSLKNASKKTLINEVKGSRGSIGKISQDPLLADPGGHGRAAGGPGLARTAKAADLQHGCVRSPSSRATWGRKRACYAVTSISRATAIR